MENQSFNAIKSLEELERDALRAIKWDVLEGISDFIERDLNGMSVRVAIELKPGGNPATSCMGYYVAQYWVAGRRVKRPEAVALITQGYLPPRRGPGRPALQSEVDLKRGGLVVVNGRVVAKKPRNFGVVPGSKQGG